MTEVKILANYLPSQIADELRVPEKVVSALIDRLQVNLAEHSVPIIRVLKRRCDELLVVEVEDLSDNEITALRKEMQQEIESSVLSDEERKQKTKFEGMVSKGKRQTAEGLRGLREGRLYREQCSCWNDYCTTVFRISGTTADNHIAWLRMTEMTEAKLGKDYVLGVVEGKELLKLESYPDLAADALSAAEETARKEGRKRKDVDVVTEIKRRLNYRPYADEMSLDEFEALQSAGFFGYEVAEVIEVVREKEAEGLSFAEAMDTTDKVVDRRKEQLKKEKQQALKDTKAKIKAVKESADLTAFEEEAKTLKHEIEVLDGGTDDSAGVEEETVGEIFEQLECAFSALEDADNSLARSDEPPLTDRQLAAILDKAEEVEKKLAHVIAKAKEMLADVEEPRNAPRIA